MKKLLAFFSILMKDMKNYYLKPPNISWGIIFPVSWTLMFSLGHPVTLISGHPTRGYGLIRPVWNHFDACSNDNL